MPRSRAPGGHGRPGLARGAAHRAAHGVLLLALACGGTPRSPEGAWQEAGTHRWRTLASPASETVGLTAIPPGRSGVTHRDDIDDERGLDNRGLLDGAGVAIGDVDGDGRPDLVFASVEVPAALYLNEGDFRFRDATAERGLEAIGTGAKSVVFADVDGDRDLDLVVGTFGGPVRLFVNDGRGHFSDATAGSGLVGGYDATTMTLADVDGNGSLDLYVATYKTRNALDAYPPQVRTFDQVLRKSGDSMVVVDGWKAEYRVESRPDLGGYLRSQRAEPDLFFLNDGAGHFRRAPVLGPRFRDEAGRPLTVDPDYFTLAARFYDVDGDGAPDLYVCNDLEDPDLFWRNDGRGNFRLAPARSLRVTSNTCMSVDFADVDRDGHVDIFTTDMLAPTRAARQRQVPTHTPLPKPVGLSPERTQWMRNMLHRGRGDGTWAQVGEYAGVSATDWTWGAAFIDVDLDGYEDLLAATGHRYDVREADPYDRIRDAFPRVPWNRESREFPRLALPGVALRNRGDLTFDEVGRAWGFGRDSAIAHGLALGDLDGDGALDAVVTRLDAPPAIYRHDGAAPRIAVRLRGDGGNTAGIGALVTLRAPGLPEQSREMTAGGMYLSGSDAEVSFAAAAAAPMTLDVRWRSGQHTVVEGVRAGRRYEVYESAARAVPAPPAPPPPLFEDATPRLRGALHVDTPFADYRRQPLLPNRLSQLGPGVTWADVTGDGEEDLVFGGGRGGRLTVLRTVGGRFTAMTPGGGPLDADITTVLPVPDHGATALVAGVSNYEAEDPAAALAMPRVVRYVVGEGVGRVDAVLGGDTASVGPLALGDVDGDGRLDLFVGARVRPGAWPVPAASRLLRRRPDGGWEDDGANARVLSTLGLVSSATWADMDGDGDPDLVVAPEFGPVKLLRNDRGVLADVTVAVGLSTLSSRWNGVTAGDFDGDGRLDLVTTSWGRNGPWQATPDRPHALHVARDAAGGLLLVAARADRPGGPEMPLDPFPRLAQAIPDLKTRIPTFTAFATSDVAAVLGPAAARAIVVGATTFDHVLWRNRGGRFEPHPLPRDAQLAPAFAPVVADFDGDGAEDLFLAQNFFPTETNQMRADAGAGLLLLGDGTGGFRSQEVTASGLSVLGDQRGAATADFDGDGRPDLAVSQNGGPMTLWRNAHGRPGVRVRLVGPADNPLGIGAQLRVLRGSAAGPVREVRAGGGYWSMDGATTVLAAPTGATAVEVRWPWGRRDLVPIDRVGRDLVACAPGAACPVRVSSAAAPSGSRR